MNVVNLLVCDPAIVLQDVEVLGSNGGSDLLCNGKELDQGVVGDICELLAVELGDDKLMGSRLVSTAVMLHGSTRGKTDSVALAQGVDVQEGEGLLALKELHGGDLACGGQSHGCISGGQYHSVPLMILQKMHEAAILVG